MSGRNDRNGWTNSPESVVDEMEYIMTMFGQNAFTIVDDNFLLPSRKGKA